MQSAAEASCAMQGHAMQGDGSEYGACGCWRTFTASDMARVAMSSEPLRSTSALEGTLHTMCSACLCLVFRS